MLTNLGYGRCDVVSIDECEDIATKAYFSGEEGFFKFDNRSFWFFARLLTNHDEQLATAPVKVIDVIAEQLEQYRGATLEKQGRSRELSK